MQGSNLLLVQKVVHKERNIDGVCLERKGDTAVCPTNWQYYVRIREEHCEIAALNTEKR